eukprot:bmy_17531T0
MGAGGALSEAGYLVPPPLGAGSAVWGHRVRGGAGGREGGRASRSRRGSTCPVIDCRARRAAQRADTRTRALASPRAHTYTHAHTHRSPGPAHARARTHVLPPAPRAPPPAVRRQPALRPRPSARARPAGEMCSGSGGSVSRGLTSCPGLTLLLAEDGGSDNELSPEREHSSMAIDLTSSTPNGQHASPSHMTSTIDLKLLEYGHDQFGQIRTVILIFEFFSPNSSKIMFGDNELSPEREHSSMAIDLTSSTPNGQHASPSHMTSTIDLKLLGL